MRAVLLWLSSWVLSCFHFQKVISVLHLQSYQLYNSWWKGKISLCYSGTKKLSCNLFVEGQVKKHSKFFYSKMGMRGRKLSGYSLILSRLILGSKSAKPLQTKAAANYLLLITCLIGCHKLSPTWCHFTHFAHMKAREFLKFMQGLQWETLISTLWLL